MVEAAAAPASSFVDDDMEDDQGPLVCKRNTEENISLSELKQKMKPSSRKSHVLTPKQLHAQIVKSRDKLFFISYAPDDGSGSKNRNKGEAKKWYLVRADLNTCEELEETQDCETTGRYYVEFYAKSLGDKTKSDGQSRWWLIWNTFRWTSGEMTIGASLEFDPNAKQAVKRRLVELSKKSNARDQDKIPQFQANLEKFTTYSDIVDLSDPTIRLLGPFDFEPVKPKDVDADLLSELGNIAPDAVFVRDRVPISQWTGLSKALNGTNMTLPTIGDKIKKKGKPFIVEQKQAPMKKSSCQLCGKVDGQEMIAFDATSSQSTLCVHKSCGLKASSGNEKKIISTKEVSELVDKALKSIRTSTASDGTTYCVLDEFRAQLSLHLNHARQNEATTAISEYPDVYPISEFDEEELQKMPDVYAYYTKADDPSGASERDAKIAKLDHDVKKRREKRLAREYTEESKKNFPHNVIATKSRSSTQHSEPPEKTKQPPKQAVQTENDPLGLAEVNMEIGALSRIHAERVRERRASSGSTPQKKAKLDEVVAASNEGDASVEAKKTNSCEIGVTPKAAKTPKRTSSGSLAVYTGPHLSIPAEPAAPYLNIPNLPPGWVCRKVPRGSTPDGSGKSLDRYYFSPGGRKFRSKPEVMRFLECLAASQGDESKAANLFLKSKKKIRTSSTNKTEESEGITVVASKKDDGDIVEMRPAVVEVALKEGNGADESGKADMDAKKVEGSAEETYL